MLDRPTQENWDEWRNGACGKWFFDHYLHTREAQMETAWTDASWITGDASQVQLDKLKSSATTLELVREVEYEGILQDLGIEVSQ